MKIEREEKLREGRAPGNFMNFVIYYARIIYLKAPIEIWPVF